MDSRKLPPFKSLCKLRCTFALAASQSGAYIRLRCNFQPQYPSYQGRRTLLSAQTQQNACSMSTGPATRVLGAIAKKRMTERHGARMFEPRHKKQQGPPNRHSSWNALPRRAASYDYNALPAYPSIRAHAKSLASNMSTSASTDNWPCSQIRLSKRRSSEMHGTTGTAIYSFRDSEKFGPVRTLNSAHNSPLQGNARIVLSLFKLRHRLQTDMNLLIG